MIGFTNFKSRVTQSVGRGGLVLKKYSPEILLGAGLIGVVTSAVMAARATLKVNEIVEEAKTTMKNIEAVQLLSADSPHKVSYTQEDHDKDVGLLYVQTSLKLVKLYGPSVGLGVCSIAAILASHGIMGRRQVSLIAAYNLLNEGYQSYRRRVVEELGEDKDKMYHLGLRDKTVTDYDKDEDGNETTLTEKKIKVYDPNFKSDYARFFDEASVQWRTDPTLNLYFLKAQQNYANDLLKSRGHVFLNEVYDMLGLPRTKAGSVVGWLKNHGDNFIDFDVYNAHSTPGRDFVNGYNRSILLDFNVDGVIYDLI